MGTITITIPTRAVHGITQATRTFLVAAIAKAQGHSQIDIDSLFTSDMNLPDIGDSITEFDTAVVAIFHDLPPDVQKKITAAWREVAMEGTNAGE